MKKLLIPGLCAFCISPAIADDIIVNPYIGAGLNVNFASYSSDMEYAMDYFGVDLPTSYFGLGVEGGIKIGYKKNVWNGGLSIAYDYIFDSSAVIENPYIEDVGVGFSAWNIGFDNYIRIAKEDDKRTDLIVGIGVGQATERISIEAPGVLSLDDSSDSTVVVLKFGTNIPLSETVDWSTTIRAFIPSKDYDVSSVISVQTGIKLNF